MKISYKDYGKVADSISVEYSNTLKNGDWIFAYNTDSDFVINLESLESANGMFYGCNLSSQGIENIASNLKKTNDGVMDVGYDTTDTDAENALQKITNRGWNVLPNRHLSETSTTGKYELCETVNDVIKVDSNYKNTDIKNGVWNEPLPILIHGSNMFQDCTNLTTFNSDLSSLTAGYFMFDSCTNLTTFNGDLSSLTDGDNMFYCCTSLTSFNGDLSSLTYAHHMFYNCTSLTSFNGALSSLTAGSMFEGCTSLTTFNGDLSGLTYGHSMFSGCIALTSFDNDLSSLTDGTWMFYNCTNLTSFNGDLSSLTNGVNMFSGCKLDLPSFMRIGDTLPATFGFPVISIGLADTHNGTAINTTDEYVETVKKIFNKGWKLNVTPEPLFTYKYVGCKTIDEVKNVDTNYIKTDIKNGVWNEPLYSLTDGYEMFSSCTALTTFNSNLHNLTKGNYMFVGCTSLTTFNGDLSYLTDAEGMFQGCTALTSFNGDLRALTNYCGNMFQGCKLDEESVIRIAETINDISDSTESTLTLGINPAIVEKDSIRAAISKIRIKGWIVNVNGGSNYPSIKKCPIITNDNFVGFRDTYPTLVQSLYHIEDGYMYDQNKDFLGVFESGGLEKSEQTNATTTTNFYNSNLRTVNTDFDNLVDGNHMFTASTELKSFKGNLSNLLIGYQMFAGCSSLTSFEGDLSSLECGYHLFCGGESDFSGRDQYTKLDKKSIKNIANSIQSTSQFPVRSEEQWHELIGDFFDWRGHLSLGVEPEILNDYEVNQYFKQIIDKGWKLYVNSDTQITRDAIDTNLNNFGVKYKNCKTVDEVKNVDANYKTTDIKDGLWNEPLPSLTDAYIMFVDCTALTTFNSDLNSLTNGDNMFHRCTNLTSFNGDLSSLTKGQEMFRNCTNLTTFNGDLSSLNNGIFMFYHCKLNKKSVNNIADAIKSIGNNSRLTLGLDNKIYKENSQSHEPFYIDEDVERDLKIIMDKGWAVDINYNYTLVKNDEEKLVNTKYAYCKDISDVKNVDANYITTDIKNGVWSEPLSYYEGYKKQGDVGLFENCTSLKTFNGDLSSLTNGYMMFSSTSLTSWDQDLPNLTIGYHMFYDCDNLITFNGDLSALTNGNMTFFDCDNLTTFNGDLSSLTNGYHMFSSTSLTSWNEPLPSLTDGYKMFAFTSLTSWDQDLPKLTIGWDMFINCTSLTSFNSDLSALTNGSGMFLGCTALTIFNSNLSSLTYGYNMFSYTSLASWDQDLLNLIDGGYMFEGCTALTTFDGNLSSLTDGTQMFYESSLESFSGDLSSLTNGYNMFTRTSLASFNGDLSNLVDAVAMFSYTSLASFSGELTSLDDGSYMFYDCTALTSFNSDLISLTDGSTMFAGCAALTTFNGDLSSLTDGSWMFQYCTNLTTFNGDLRNLTNGYHMFQSCKLNTESIKCIADTIKNVTELTDGGDVDKRIHIGTENKPPTEEEKGYFKKMRDEKGWTVYVNGSEFTET